ncbi:hypothetical protein ACMXYV_12075 [Neptuniibacter sp. SY11_33]|uniref:hypothetical protein n=1 Tax=Neptuniibacter sp. SY11_33 TaxID=3398215 RepID=UPI0039F4C163
MLLPLKGDVDISGIVQESDFPEAFKALLKSHNDLEDWTVLRQKSALSSESLEYKRKVQDDLARTHMLLKINKTLM